MRAFISVLYFLILSSYAFADIKAEAENKYQCSQSTDFEFEVGKAKSVALEIVTKNDREALFIENEFGGFAVLQSAAVVETSFQLFRYNPALSAVEDDSKQKYYLLPANSEIKAIETIPGSGFRLVKVDKSKLKIDQPIYVVHIKTRRFQFDENGVLENNVEPRITVDCIFYYLKR